MSQDDDQLVERVARAIIEARFADDDDGYDMPVTDYDRDLARAALSALPERELLREALEALRGIFARLDHPLNGSQRVHYFLRWPEVKDARAAADKIRAALEHQQKGEGL
jgi:hypothetical protein